MQSLKKLAVVVDGDCLLCGRVGEGEICASCEADLEGVDDPPPGQAVSYDAVTSVFAYRFPLERLIHRFKYAGDLAVGHWLASRLAHRVRRESPPDLIVVPPSTRMRLRERGFNPAAEVAKVVAHACNVQFESACVQRAREHAPQAGLKRRERLANLRAAFRCTRSVAGLDVAIVDDVITTGATADAMARELKRAGASRVRVWAVARTPEPGR